MILRKFKKERKIYEKKKKITFKRFNFLIEKRYVNFSNKSAIKFRKPILAWN